LPIVRTNRLISIARKENKRCFFFIKKILLNICIFSNYIAKSRWKTNISAEFLKKIKKTNFPCYILSHINEWDFKNVKFL
jgi:hypothetical protein